MLNALTEDISSDLELRPGMTVTMMGDPQRGRHYRLLNPVSAALWCAAPADGEGAHRLFADADRPDVALIRQDNIRVVRMSPEPAVSGSGTPVGVA